MPRRTKPQGRHPDKRLTTGFVRSAVPGRYCDGQGLYLYVQPSGARSWVQRLVIHGRRRDLGTRQRGAGARWPRRARRRGPTASWPARAATRSPKKRRAEKMPTFAEAARRVLEQKRAGWRNGRHPQSWWTSLERYAFPRIGARPVSDGDERRGARGAHADLAREGADRAAGARADPCGTGVGRGGGAGGSDNPCDRIGPVLGPQRATVEHMRALRSPGRRRQR